MNDEILFSIEINNLKLIKSTSVIVFEPEIKIFIDDTVINITINNTDEKTSTMKGVVSKENLKSMDITIDIPKISRESGSQTPSRIGRMNERALYFSFVSSEINKEKNHRLITFNFFQETEQ